MIRPCHCKGSVAFVHVACLNEWRKTSDTAYYHCPICKYQYNIQKTKWAELLCNEQLVSCVAILCIIITTFLVGYLAIKIGGFFIDGDIVHLFVSQLGLYDANKYRSARILSKLLVDLQSLDYFKNEITNNSFIISVVQSVLINYYSVILFIVSSPVLLAIVDSFMVGFVICGILGFLQHLRQMFNEEDHNAGMASFQIFAMHIYL